MQKYIWSDRINFHEIISRLKNPPHHGETISPFLQKIAISEEEVSRFFHAYTPSLVARYSPHLITTRARIHAWIKHELLEARMAKEPNAETYVAHAQSLPNMLLPERIDSMDYAFDMIASVFVKSEGAKQRNPLPVGMAANFTKPSVQTFKHMAGKNNPVTVEHDGFYPSRAFK